MTADFCELHDVHFPCETCERIRASIMKVKVANQQAIASLAEQCIQAGAGYRPGEHLLEWFQKAERVLGQWDFPWTPSQVFCFMRDSRDAVVGVYPRGSEGEDLPGTHTSAKTDEERESDFARFRRWWYGCDMAKMPDQTAHLTWHDTSGTRWIVPRRPEADERALPNPLPLVAGDREDVAEKVDVALYRALTDYFETGVPPYGEIEAIYSRKLSFDEFGKITQQCIEALDLKHGTSLPRADLVPVAKKSLSERLSGYRPTFHRQNLGLLRSGPEGCGRFGLEGARLANSVPIDLDSPLPTVLVDVRHVGASVGDVWEGNRTVPCGSVVIKGCAK